MRRSVGLLIVAFLIVPAALAQEPSTSSGPYDPYPARAHGLAVAEAGSTYVVLEWDVDPCHGDATADVTVRHRPRVGQRTPSPRDDGWTQTEHVTDGRLRIDGLEPSTPYWAHVKATSSCGGPFSPEGEGACFRTLPAGPACEAPPEPTWTSGAPVAPVAEVRVLKLAENSARVVWQMDPWTCGDAVLSLLVYVRGNGTDIDVRQRADGAWRFIPAATASGRGPGPHTAELEGLPPGKPVRLEFQVAGEDACWILRLPQAYCFRTPPQPPECPPDVQAAEPRWTDADDRQAIPAPMLGGLTVVALAMLRQRGGPPDA